MMMKEERRKKKEINERSKIPIIADSYSPASASIQPRLKQL